MRGLRVVCRTFGALSLSVNGLRRKGGQFLIVEHQPPSPSSGPFVGYSKDRRDRSYSYQLEGEDDAYILIKRWEKRRKIEGDVVPLGGSSWWHKDASFDDPIEVDDEVEPTVKWQAEIAETVPDTEIEESAENGKGEKIKDGRKQW